MERANRLRSLWSWLPDFRAVAETEHLPSAGAALHVSASSLSRTIRLLEEDIGQPLFDRQGRALVLNAAGRELLQAVRRSMRDVDEVLGALGPGRLIGEVTVSVAGPLAPVFLLPALESLSQRHPELRAVVASVPGPSVNEALRVGRVDLALLEEPIPGDDIEIEALTEVSHALVCGATHPLARQRSLPASLEAHSFVAPARLPDGRVPDRWPPDRPRRVGLFVNQMQVGIEACRTGRYLAVLPWPVAERAGLIRLPARGIPASTLHAARRPSLETRGRTEALLDAVRESLPPAP